MTYSKRLLENTLWILLLGLATTLTAQKYYVPGYLIKKTSTGEVQFFDPTGGKTLPSGWFRLTSASGTVAVAQGTGFASNTTGVGLPGQLWLRSPHLGYITTSSLSDTLLIGLQANHALVTGDAKLYLPAGTTISLGGILIGSQQDYGSKKIIRIGNKSKKTAAEETGVENIAIGDDVLTQSTKGSGNTAVGDEAARDNTEGKYNSILGYEAGRENETGHFNTYIGHAAGRDNTTGGSNTNIGSGAGIFLQGTANVIVGYDAGRSEYRTKKTSSYNTVIGFESGHGLDGGVKNVTLGSESGYNIKWASDNVLLGYRAGYYIAKGKNTIVGAGILGLATDTAVLRIGAGEETYIHGNKDGNIGIGADASAAYKLKVTGDIHTTGKLGVGTSPSTSNKLEVNGTSLLRDDVAIGTSSTAADLKVYGTSYLKGNVGIGVTNPDYQLTLPAGKKINLGGMLIGSQKDYATKKIIRIGNKSDKDGALEIARYNTAIGENALRNVTKGGYNTAIGPGTLSSLTTGLNNTAMGVDALNVLDGGNNNTAIGYYALNKVKGSHNTAIGAYAGYTGSATVTGTDGTSIGYKAPYWAKRTTLGHDDNTFLTIVNVSDAGLDLTKGYVGIGIASPKAPLHVKGVTSTSVSFSDYAFIQAVSSTPDSVHSGKNGSFVYGAYFESSILALGVVASVSDARKKINLGVSDKAADLETLQQIKITNYVKKDPAERHGHIEKKVIAQEVEEIYPTAVTQTAGLVPDVFQKQISSSLVGTTLRVAIDSIGDLKQGDELKLLVFRDTKKSEFLHEIEKVQLTKLKGKELTFSLTKSDAEVLAQQPFKVLVYGRHVKDMRTVDYDAIAMLNVSATQALAAKVAELEVVKWVVYLLVGCVLILVALVLVVLFRKPKS